MKLGLCSLHGTLDTRMVGVAQLVRALGCGPRGRGFESPRSPQIVGRYQFRYRRHEFLIGEHMALSPSVVPRNAPLAQLVEQRTLNPQVLGSIPRGRTTLLSCSVRKSLSCMGSSFDSSCPVRALSWGTARIPRAFCCTDFSVFIAVSNRAAILSDTSRSMARCKW